MSDNIGLQKTALNKLTKVNLKSQYPSPSQHICSTVTKLIFFFTIPNLFSKIFFFAICRAIVKRKKTLEIKFLAGKMRIQKNHYQRYTTVECMRTVRLNNANTPVFADYTRFRNFLFLSLP